MEVDDALELTAEGVVLLDVRSPAAFAAGHVRGSVSVGVGDRFAERVGTVVRPDQGVILVGDPGQVDEARACLDQLGFDEVIDAVTEVERVLADRPDLAATLPVLSADELRRRLVDEPDLVLVDVRDAGADTTVAGSTPLPLLRLLSGLQALDPGRPVVVVGDDEHQSTVGASALRARGFPADAAVAGPAPSVPPSAP